MRTHIVNTLVKWRDIILLVWCHIKGLLSQERLVKDEGQSHQVRAVWREMAECITLQLSPAPLLAAWPQELPSGPLHHLVSEEHGDPCIPENHCVETQLCHGVGKATLSLSSGPWRFSAHTDPGEQWLLSPEPNSEASVGLRNPPEMEHTVPPESEDATHRRPSLSVPEPTAALRQTMILGSSWGTWGVDSPPLRLMVQRLPEPLSFSMSPQDHRRPLVSVSAEQNLQPLSTGPDQDCPFISPSLTQVPPAAPKKDAAALRRLGAKGTS
nr:uncharacterized protein LOC101787547 [Cavia porcellus]